jgi:arabinose-5-phosphate isomerase
MVPAPELEPLEPSAPLPEVINHLTQGSPSRGTLGATWMHNGRGDLAGLITDGDLRRTLQRHGPQEWPAITAAQMATPQPITVPPEMLAAEALALMEHNPRQVISRAASKCVTPDRAAALSSVSMGWIVPLPCPQSLLLQPISI